MRTSTKAHTLRSSSNTRSEGLYKFDAKFGDSKLLSAKWSHEYCRLTNVPQNEIPPTIPTTSLNRFDHTARIRQRSHSINLIKPNFGEAAVNLLKQISRGANKSGFEMHLTKKEQNVPRLLLNSYNSKDVRMNPDCYAQCHLGNATLPSRYAMEPVE